MNDLFSAEFGLVKYVRIGSEYRFCSKYTDHKTLVKDGERADSAGFVHYDTGETSKFFRLMPESSMTLRIGPDMAVDRDGLSKVLGMPCANKS